MGSRNRRSSDRRCPTRCCPLRSRGRGTQGVDRRYRQVARVGLSPGRTGCSSGAGRTRNEGRANGGGASAPGRHRGGRQGQRIQPRRTQSGHRSRLSSNRSNKEAGRCSRFRTQIEKLLFDGMLGGPTRGVRSIRRWIGRSVNSGEPRQNSRALGVSSTRFLLRNPLRASKRPPRSGKLGTRHEPQGRVVERVRRHLLVPKRYANTIFDAFTRFVRHHSR